MYAARLRLRPFLRPLEDRTAPAAGDLDPTFGTAGRVAQPFDFPDQPDVIVGDMAVQPDGKIVLAGGEYAFRAARLNPDGTPDPTFGSGGVVTAVLDPGNPDRSGVGLWAAAQAVALQPDGKIVLAGGLVGLSPGGQGFEVLRLNPDGTPDATFGSGGWAVVLFPAPAPGGPTAASARDVAVQPDGRIVVAGNAFTGPGDTDFAAARLNPDGTPDHTFGDRGRMTVGFDRAADRPYDEASAVLLRPDGRIVLTGHAGGDLAAVRLTAAGGPDPTFGTGGRAMLTDLPGAARDEFASAGALLPDGRILILGTVLSAGSGDSVFTVARLNPDGTPDPTFGAGGRTPGDPTFRGLGQGIALQPDGGIVVASFTAVVRLNADGTPDRTFGADGRTAENLDEQGQGVELWTPAVLPGGKILVAGNAAVAPPFEGHFFGGYLVARLLGDPPPLLIVAGGPIDGTAVPIRPSGGAYTVGEPIAFFPGAGVGVRPVAADVTGDGVPDLIGGAGPGGGPRVAVIDGTTGVAVADFFAFEASFTGGVYVAAGDLTGDGVAELVVTPDEGGGPRVRIFTGVGFAQLADFFGIDDPNFRGGARAAVGDLNGDGVGDLLVSAGFGGGPRVAGFDGRTLAGDRARLFGDFFAFETGLRNGVFLTAGDMDGDGFAEVVAGGGSGGGPRVSAFRGADLLRSEPVRSADFFAGDTANRGGVRVAVKDLDGDEKADLVVGSGAGAGSRVTAYHGLALAAGGTPVEAFGFDAFPGFSGGVYVG